MANNHMGEITLKLDGVDYVLRPTFEAMAQIENQTGQGVLLLTNKLIAGSARLTDIAIIIAEGIKASDNKIPNDFYDKIMKTGYVALIDQVSVFLSKAVTGDRPYDGKKSGE